MDSLRVFKTFKSSSSSKLLRPRSRPVAVDERGKTIMRERSLEDKPSVSRSKILEKLEKFMGPARADISVKGQRFGDGFMKQTPVDDKPSVGDISKNDPRSSLTTEKLKSMLNSNVVNFSGKEKEILNKILGK